MKFDDKRKAHLENISLETSRVDLSSPIVFLCGGLVDIEQPQAPSVRDAFLRYVASVGCDLVDKITLAEEFKDWIHDSVYRNLLEFENDIAHISSLIVIVLESPGALAELGLFVRNDVLNKKLVVFVNDEHYSTDSFISLGPLRYLEGIKEKTVCVYPWSQKNIDKSLRESLPEMHADLMSAMSELDSSEAFDMNNDGHVSFVFYEFIRLFRAIKLFELESYAKTVGLTISREKTKRLIFLLIKFELIATKKRGHDRYYYPLVDVDKIHFGGRFNKNDVKVSTMQFYAFNESELRRFNFIKGLQKLEAEAV